MHKKQPRNIFNRDDADYAELLNRKIGVICVIPVILSIEKSKG
jgi:hypothetical protein